MMMDSLLPEPWMIQDLKFTVMLTEATEAMTLSVPYLEYK